MITYVFLKTICDSCSFCLLGYWSLPFHDFSIVGDVCTLKDKHRRPLYDTIHVASVNPVFLYTMKPTSDQMVRIPLNHFFDNSSRGGGSSWRNNILPKLKMAPLGGKCHFKVLLVHDRNSEFLIRSIAICLGHS